MALSARPRAMRAGNISRGSTRIRPLGAHNLARGAQPNRRHGDTGGALVRSRRVGTVDLVADATVDAIAAVGVTALLTIAGVK